MALLPEELHNYGPAGLFAMVDLLNEIEARAANYHLPVAFMESLDELRGEIDQEIVTVMGDVEAREMQWLMRHEPEVLPCLSLR
jgi:hypothetical protein